MPRAGIAVPPTVSLMKQRLGESDKGGTLVEYVLVVSLIAMVVIASLYVIGPRVERLYTGVLPGL